MSSLIQTGPENNSRKRVVRGEEYDELNADVTSSDPVYSLQQSVFRLADKHPTLTVEGDIEATTKLIWEELKANGPAASAIPDVLYSCLLEMPHKMNTYIRLLRGLSENRDLLGEIIQRIGNTFTGVLSNGGPWRHAVQAVRVFSSLTVASLLPRPVIEVFITDALAHLSSSDLKVFHADFLLWIIGQALLILGRSESQAAIVAAFEIRKSGKAAVPKDLSRLFNLLSQISSAEIEETTELYIQDVSLIMPPAEQINVDTHWDGDFEVLPLCEDIGLSEVDLYNTFLACRVLVESLEFNHRRCADIILNGFPNLGDEINKIASQFLFSELLRNRRNGFPALVYETLLMDCCRINRSFPPAMARCINIIYQRLDELGYSMSDKLSSWFSHHLSNFDYKWNWNAWSGVLDAPPTSMQYVFVRFTLEKLIRLSYREKLEKALPEAFHSLLPDDPSPIYKYTRTEAEGEMANGDFELAEKVAKAIDSRQLVEVIRESLGPINGAGLDPSQREILIQGLLMVGSRSLSHMLTVIERYLPLFQLIVTCGIDPVTPEARTHGMQYLLDQIYSFWRNGPLFFEFIVERLVNYRVLIPTAVFQWALKQADEEISDQDIPLFNSLKSVLSRSLFLRTIQQSKLAPKQASQRMQGQDDEKMRATALRLETEYEDCMSFVIEKLALLSDQVVASDDCVDVVETACRDLISELLVSYNEDCVLISKRVLSSVGRRIKSESIKVLLEQCNIRGQ